MNIPFDIVKGKGPVIPNPLCTAVDVKQVREFVPEDSVPYVGEALTILRKEVLGMFPFHFPPKTVFYSFFLGPFLLFIHFSINSHSVMYHKARYSSFTSFQERDILSSLFIPYMDHY
jgi:uroporphyrinogen-III decarboxylase